MGTWGFGYDHLNRLASGVPSTGVYSGQSLQLCMDYDSFGNRTQADLQTTTCNPNPAPSVAQSSYDPSTASYNAANQITWLQNVAPNGLSYDGSGNVTYDGINYYAYDGEGRICATETWAYSGGVAAYGYLYDGEGRRVAKGTVNPAPNGQAPSCDPSSNGFTLTESYVLGQGGERLTTMEWTGGASGTSSWQSTNVYGAGKLIATYDSTGNPAYTPTNGLPAQITALHFQLADPLGTRRIQTNSVGEAELDCQSLPFGDQLNCLPDPRAPNDNPDEDATGSMTGIHFTGKERDTESGNDYFEARYYASTMGRFMSPDQLGGKLANPQSLNRYVYGLNNPLVNTDPTGMYVCEDSTNCDSQNDKSFAKSLADAQTAAGALKDQYGAKSDEYTSAQRAIDAYGAQGVDNGVNVRFDSNVQGGVTEVSGVANGDKTPDNPNGQNINVTFNPNSVGGNFSGGLVAHEGSHVADGSDWVSSGFSPGMDPTRYGTEIGAYSVQFNVTQALPAFRTAFGVSIGGVTVIPGEPFKDARPDFQNLLKTSPLYGFTYKDTTPAFVKGSVVPQ